MGKKKQEFDVPKVHKKRGNLVPVLYGQFNNWQP